MSTDFHMLVADLRHFKVGYLPSVGVCVLACVCVCVCVLGEGTENGFSSQG